jgi:hypothetical protein
MKFLKQLFCKHDWKIVNYTFPDRFYKKETSPRNRIVFQRKECNRCGKEVSLAKLEGDMEPKK